MLYNYDDCILQLLYSDCGSSTAQLLSTTYLPLLFNCYSSSALLLRYFCSHSIISGPVFLLLFPFNYNTISLFLSYSYKTVFSMKFSLCASHVLLLLSSAAILLLLTHSIRSALILSYWCITVNYSLLNCSQLLSSTVFRLSTTYRLGDTLYTSLTNSAFSPLNIAIKVLRKHKAHQEI